MYALKDEDLGSRGKGRRLECTVCGHSWFQSRDRIMSMRDGMELVERPQYEIDRIMLNIQENKSPGFVGDFKLYVGNIAFECSEQDIYNTFKEIGSVGEVSLVRDDIGRNRGFGFVTMRTAQDGEAAMAQLDGTEINGRNIAVRPSNN
ncbi:Cold-inducible RNA-binding protein [Seminavis robusta]|uniref:Cold-inducible RNA-binding protein n=1 Tax=Seminavis robusta TaxID=568900 RepID=A0A9N8D9Y6_9STRA|nr:Cold-inducible RNA-binding protein [Seminavis robusta]|eukprot:Sro53_g031580.1 Cold-inducible RNA-binding protein (148) ;mRNA; f:128666-129203